jgi:hypothetical protein
MKWLRSEEEVDALIDDMITRSEGKYITQGVSFNKTCPRQMSLLKNALMCSASFSGLGKELLAIRFSENGSTLQNQSSTSTVPGNNSKPAKANLGNFI